MIEYQRTSLCSNSSLSFIPFTSSTCSSITSYLSFFFSYPSVRCLPACFVLDTPLCEAVDDVSAEDGHLDMALKPFLPNRILTTYSLFPLIGCQSGLGGRPLRHHPIPDRLSIKFGSKGTNMFCHQFYILSSLVSLSPCLTPLPLDRLIFE